ncbi:MAG: stage III sporulation protein AE [Ruminococcaceae bacterium]|nr:stage III sporulation protein AE [Oscillospiraceae bacterium]
MGDNTNGVMKRWICMCILLLTLVQTAQAATLPEELGQALPPEAEDILDELSEQEMDFHTLSRGFALLWDKACRILGKVIKESVGSGVLVLGIVLLCSMADDCMQAAESDQGKQYVAIAGSAAITVAAAGRLHSLIALGVEMIGELNVFSKALLPTLAAALAAGGGVASAGLRHVAGVFFSDVLMTAIQDILLPLVYFYIAVAAAHAALPEFRLKSIAKAISKGTAWLLSGALALYTGYLTVSGVVAQSADTLTAQLTRSAMGAVPVVGSVLSDSAGAVLSGAALLKNTVGVWGMLAVLAICFGPVLRLAVQYLIFKAMAFLAGTIGTASLVELVEALGTAFGMVLGMTGACAILLLISLITAISVVII